MTFACYGTHLHGEEYGSVDRWHNRFSGLAVAAAVKRVAFEANRMDQPPYHLDATRRETVLAGIQERSKNRGWNLFAAHARTNHVHVVIEAETRPERVMTDLKSFASRCLNNRGLDTPNRKRWTRHGSTRWLWKRTSILAAIDYVVNGQGEGMAVFKLSDAPSGRGSASGI